jgi:uncharacterized membrane protein
VKPEAFTAALDDDRVVAAIQAAESRTRAEVRVHVTRRAVEDPQTEGAVVFEKLGMTATRERNGVLIFLAPRSQRFAVLGDRGIHERCGEGFWTAVADAMSGEFRQGRFTEGVVAGIARVADELARHFPRFAGDQDRNELPDTVSRD